MFSVRAFWRDITEFTRFTTTYLKGHLFTYGSRFERIKGFIVAILVVKRGKYSQSFLNTSFFLLISAAVVAGPAIAENNPFISDYLNASQSAPSGAVLDVDVYSKSTKTTFSQKPRDSILEYTVKSGDTLASVGKQFDISVDTIKWENDLSGEIIKPGQKLRILPVTGIAHKVSSGETIYSIAKKFHTDAQAIVNFPFNDYADAETFALTSGQILFVPNGSIVPVAPSRLNGPGGFYNGPIVAGKGSGNFIWPASGLITTYPVWYHMGLDIAHSSSPPILASDGGTVTYAGCINWGYGCHVIIDHGNGFQSLYAHLSRIGVNPGQSVGRGSTIGNMGSTGRSTGPHLHFEIRQGGVLLNPLSYLK